jgi:hypothetical protein
MLSSARRLPNPNTRILNHRASTTSTREARYRGLRALPRVLKVDGLPTLTRSVAGASTTEVREHCVEAAGTAELRVEVGFVVGSLDEVGRGDCGGGGECGEGREGDLEVEEMHCKSTIVCWLYRLRLFNRMLEGLRDWKSLMNQRVQVGGS